MRSLLAAPLVALVSTVALAAPKLEVGSATINRDAAQAAKLIRVPAGWRADVWAAEPMLANPVGFGFDERGRIYVAETFRLHAGVVDNRGRMRWPSEAFMAGLTPERRAGLADELLDRDLAARTIEDRAAMLKTYFDPDKLRTHAERVSLLEDTDGDGRADRAKVFAGGFNDPLDGLASSVLVRQGDVFLANIPSLWLLRDTNGDGAADVRRSLYRGFGVRFAFTGHDLHGLRLGPDGRIYFSVGDRGAHVPTPRGPISVPDTGAVFRCELDGSDLELFATGLRNPTDLAFDAQGNLFTGDNNSDGGDRARWVYLIEGADSGWRVGFQYLETRGPWNEERMWHEAHPDQPAHLVPPIENLTDGPAGVVFHPGTGATRGLGGRFLLVDFRGQPSSSGVHGFRLEPRGASFKLVDADRPIWGVLATDVDVGPDGAIYVSDWIEGWNKSGKGRIFRITDPARGDEAGGRAIQRLMAEGMGRRPEAELARLLAHADLRVRLEAQLELAARGGAGPLVEAARRGQGAARLHGVWGLGQLLRAGMRDPRRPAPAVARDTVVALIDDAEAEVRAQAAKTAGDARLKVAVPRLVARLEDDSPRVRSLAAIALGRVGGAAQIPALLALAERNGDRDPVLRHAVVFALATIGETRLLTATATHERRSVRLAALLALRRLRHADVSHFLADRDPAIVREAARAVNDEPIDAAAAALSAVAIPASDPPLLSRIVNASFRLGTPDGARRLAAVAADTRVAVPLREEALRALAAWGAPSSRDRVTGAWHPLPATRDPAPAADALAASFPTLSRTSAEPVRAAAVETAVKLRIAAAEKTLAALAVNRTTSTRVRVAALDGLADTGSAALPRALAAAARSPDPVVRAAALRLAPRLQPARAVPMLERAMARGSQGEKQVALAAAAQLPGEPADRLLGRWLDQLLSAKLPAEVTLDLLEAASSRKSAALAEKLAAYDKRRPDDELGRFRETLVGGDARRGRQIFFTKAEVSCLRCHRVGGPGGEVGPDLQGIAARRSREYLLESIAAPSKTFAEGFESLLVTLKDGTIVGGTAREETADTLTLVSPENVKQTVKKADIKTRERAASGMPDGLADILTKRELRDLLEYLASLK